MTGSTRVARRAATFGGERTRPRVLSFGALAETGFSLRSRPQCKVRDGEGAIARTRGACAPQNLIAWQ